MSITQTVEVPASRRLTIDVPLQTPIGAQVIIQFPVADETGNTAEKDSKKASQDELITARLNEIYETVDSSLEPCFVMAQAEVYGKEDW
jgi:hypothetical protein